MFKLTRTKFRKITLLKLINTKTKENVSIIPEFGANVYQIELSLDSINHKLLDCFSNYGELIKNKMFKGAKLIPFPNRINKGAYTFLGVKYQLPINSSPKGHAIHGLIYDKKFKVTKVSISDHGISVRLSHDLNRPEGYPFHINVCITYYLNKKGFRCKTVVKNKDLCPVPFGDGWHPYILTDKRVNNFHIRLPSNKKIIVDRQMIPTGKIVNIRNTRFKINNKKLDTCYLIKRANRIAVTEIYEPKKRFNICVWQESGKNKYNYIQIFTSPSRDSIAIEPMTCNIDAFNNKKGLIILKPNESFIGNYGIFLR